MSDPQRPTYEQLDASCHILATENHDLRMALSTGTLALSQAIGLLEAHWEVCADPFPDALLRRALDRMEAAQSGGTPGGSDA